MHTTAHKHKPHPHQGPIVPITVNRKVYEIKRGRHTVKEIKELADVPPADELEQVIDGNLEPLPDDGVVTIKGGEVFLSHPRDCGAS